MTAKLRGTGQAAVAFFGDGAAGQGAAHEGMNLAATWTLPVVFICENNQFALSADWRAQRAVEDLADRAAGYGMAGEIVDGNDLLAVEDAVARALARAREGAGPTFLEMKTFRRMQHSMRANLPDVRDPALVEEWEAKDPLPRFERLLRDLGELDDDRVEAVLQRGRARRRARDRDRARRRGRERRRPPARGASRRSGAIRRPPPETERKLGFVAAVREALDLELEADPNVIVIGEDIGKVGGLFRATEGLYERYGAERIRDTPLTESGFVGCGIGAALTGLRPVVELQFSDFAGVAFDQIMNQAAKLRFMMGGTPSIPLVIRMVSGGGVRLGAQHSQSLEALFAHIPGLVVAMPSTPYDAKGLLSAAIRGDNPVIFLEQKLLFFGEPAPVPPERYGIELGVGRVAREGTDVTVVALGALVPHALRAAHELEGEGVSVEVVDPRTLVPLDTALIAASVAKTHRLVVAHEAVQFCGFGSEIAAHVARALLLGSRRARRPRRRRLAPDPVPEGPRSWRRCRGRPRSSPPCGRWPPAEAARLLGRLEEDGGDHDGAADDRHQRRRLRDGDPRPERPEDDLQQRDQRHLGRDDQPGAHREEHQPETHLTDAEQHEEDEVALADARGCGERPDHEDDEQLREADRRRHRDVAPVAGDDDADRERERHQRARRRRRAGRRSPGRRPSAPLRAARPPSRSQPCA